MGEIATPTDCEKCARERANCTDVILESKADKKLIIAGPGTGKSFLFQQICKQYSRDRDARILALSFINELVDDLTRDLYGLAEVRTLHSFALGNIPGDRKVFLGLGSVIERDHLLATGNEVDFNAIFCNLLEEEDALGFYSARRRYYNFFSPHCSVFTLIKMFEQDGSRIPAYSLVLVDEYQDFNRLESRLLALLASRSPMLLVGDDDQSLYDFKFAEPGEIRSKHSSGEFATFELPYCSRCTRVLIDAYANLIEVAQSKGFLQERAQKPYLYFPSADKDALSEAYPRIAVKRAVFENVIAYNIETEIKTLFDPQASQLPSVLVICPLRRQVDAIAKGLRKRGFKNVEAMQRQASDNVMEGFSLMLEDASCNLAWRLLFEAECQRQGANERLAEVVRESVRSGGSFKDLLTAAERRDIRKANATLRKIKNRAEVDEAAMATALTILGYDPAKIAQSKIREELTERTTPKNIYKHAPIKIVTMLGAKGLTRDYTFLVNFDDRYLLERGDDRALHVTDGSICRFLVALTRATKRVAIYTSKEEHPTFVQWLAYDLLEDIT